MKKILLTTSILFCLSAPAFSKEKVVNNIKGFAAVKDMYKRVDAERQPYFQTTYKGIALLNEINQFFNLEIKYKQEPVSEDYWQTPRETLQKMSGDCEDFAITKWQALLDNGVPERSMWFLVGFNKNNNNIMHTVLAVETKEGTYYLDDLTNDITQLNITPAGSYKINRYGYTYEIKN